MCRRYEVRTSGSGLSGFRVTVKIGSLRARSWIRVSCQPDYRVRVTLSLGLEMGYRLQRRLYLTRKELYWEFKKVDYCNSGVEVLRPWPYPKKTFS